MTRVASHYIRDAAKTPKPGTRRRALYDFLLSRPNQWIEFDPVALGYKGPSDHAIHSDIIDLRDSYGLDIRTGGRGLIGKCLWRYVPGETR